MDITKFILIYYKEQQYVFGVCPCCNKIFRLSDCSIYFEGKKFPLKQLEYLNEQREIVEDKEDTLMELETHVDDVREEIEGLEEEYKCEIEPIIEKKYKVEGRKQALERIKKVDKVFTKRKIDQRDVRLLFDPIEYLVFRGLTDGEGISKISFVGKTPQSKRQETIIDTLEKSIRQGNYEFTLIRISDDGGINYSC